MDRRNLPKDKAKLMAAGTREPDSNEDGGMDEGEKGSNEMTA